MAGPRAGTAAGMSATTGGRAGRDGGLDEQYPGAHAGRPQEVPARGWFQIARRGWKEFQADQMMLIAAGVAFYAFLSLVPSIVAAMLVYGLVTEPSQVQAQLQTFADVLPASARDLLDEQMSSLAAANDQGLGIGLVVSLVLALWSASGGTGNLVTAVNTAYDEEETRGFVKRKALALGLTLGAILVFVVTLALVAVFPAVANALDLPTPLRIGVEALRWAVVLAVVGLSLAVLYRVAPDRDSPKLRWVSVGATVAVVLWIGASVVFSLYVNNFGSYGKTYGSLAGVVVLLLWLWISLVAVLLGAEINAESEKQTVQDTTHGPDRPMGERDAVKADLGPADPEPADGDPARSR